MQDTMTETHAFYQSPLSSRYASERMLRLFSPQFKYSTWRKLWIALAESEKELGLPITREQIDNMRTKADEINFEAAEAHEEVLHHDVMAHIHAFGDQCPAAKGIIHLGATSCFVTDNTDVIQIREGLNHLCNRLRRVIKQLAKFAENHAKTACLGFTHFQPAQPTTVGKRACLWLQDLVIDFDEMERRKDALQFLGVKGTTGTQASFLSLFRGDRDKVRELDRLVAEKMGFSKLFSVSGQTYTRKQDHLVLQTLAGLAVTAHKCATDLRLLASLKEVEEPFAKTQVGSSAMPYKRNPILSERICSLARFLISLSQNPAYTAATQWLERSLDDSANRRITISEAFLTADALINLLIKVTAGLVVNQAVIERRLQEELPFMATENILMQAVEKGGDRQSLHEKLRLHSREAASEIKEKGRPNDLLERISQDPDFGLTKEQLEGILNVKDFIGLAPEQTAAYIQTLREREIL